MGNPPPHCTEPLASTLASHSTPQPTLFSNKALDIIRLARKIRFPATFVGIATEDKRSDGGKVDQRRASYAGSHQFMQRELPNGDQALFYYLRDGRHTTEELGLGVTWKVAHSKGLIVPFINAWRKTATKEALANLTPLDDATPGEIQASYQYFDVNMAWVLAWKVLWVVLGKVGIQGSNPIEISARELRILVWPHRTRRGNWPRNWKPLIERALWLLKCITLHYCPVTEPGNHCEYRLIARWSYHAAGKGGHGDGTYHVQVMQRLLGVLNYFEVDKLQQSGANKSGKTYYDFRRKLSPEKKAALSGGRAGEAGDSYSKWDPHLPFYLSAANFTPAQMNLYCFVVQNITLNKDASRMPSLHSTVTNQSQMGPRLYTRQFCDELPSHEEMLASLGHFSANPELGFYFKTLAAKCHALPVEEEAGICHKERTTLMQEDLEHVVVKTLGGMVLGQHCAKNLSWIRLTEFTALPLQVLWNEIRVFCFLPKNYQVTLMNAWEDIVGPDALEEKKESDDELRLQICLALKRNNITKKDLAARLQIVPSTLTYWLTPEDLGEVKRKRSTPIPADAIPKLREWLASLVLRAA